MPKLDTSEEASTSSVREEVYTFAGEEVRCVQNSVPSQIPQITFDKFRISRAKAEKVLTPANMEPVKRM